MTVKITNRREFTRGIAQEVINQMMPAVFEESHKDLEIITAEEIKRSFGENEIVKGIFGFYQGDEDRDIQAIFGLTDILAKDFVNFTINEIENSLDFKISRQRDRYGRFAASNTITVNLSLNAQDRFTQAILNSPYSSYLNEAKKKIQFEIPWLDWLINGFRTEASLEFDLTSIQIINSRSKRAIMDGDGGWTWRGNNFLSDIFSDESFLDRSEKRIKDYLEQQIGRLFG